MFCTGGHSEKKSISQSIGRTRLQFSRQFEYFDPEILLLVIIPRELCVEEYKGLIEIFNRHLTNIPQREMVK